MNAYRLRRIMVGLMLGVAAVSLSSVAMAGADKKPKLCTKNKDCSKKEYCDATPKCPGKSAKGECKAKPDACPSASAIYQPVMGCDGKEYPSACNAAMAGQSNTGPVNIK